MNCGLLADYLLARFEMSVVAVRKIFTCGGKWACIFSEKGDYSHTNCVIYLMVVFLNILWLSISTCSMIIYFNIYISNQSTCIKIVLPLALTCTCIYFLCVKVVDIACRHIFTNSLIPWYCSFPESDGVYGCRRLCDDPSGSHCLPHYRSGAGRLCLGRVQCQSSWYSSTGNGMLSSFIVKLELLNKVL